MIAQVKDVKRRTRFANACRGLPVLDALLPLDCALFRKSQPWRFYAGPTLALELSGSTAWLAGHANPAELAGFLSFCGCESAILDEAVCPPPDGWRKAETLTVFGLPQAGPLPLPAVDESLWTQLTLCREASAARVAEALYPADLTRQADFYSELCTKRSRGRAVAWTLEQGSAVVCTVGAYALCNGQAYMACGQTAEPLRGKGIGGRLIVEKAMELCQPYFRQMEEIRDFNQLKMLKAFADTQMSSTDMLGTTGYGLWDTGRAKLEQIFAQVMGAEDALVRSQFQSGTHTLAVALFGLLRAGDTLLAATGRPYYTLEGVIGLDGKGKGTGTLMDYGVNYDEAPLKADFTPDYDLIAKKAPGAKVCHIQRSRGYLQRNAFDLATIRKIADTARAANPEIIIFVDNCYGEFTQTQEPCQVGADIAVGSLIKNPGGGIAPTGGYIVGRKDLVELCAYRLNAPGLGKELGCTLETPRDMYLGFYYAPGVVCEAIKTAIYAQCMLELLGKKPIPRYCEAHNDIVTCFDAGTAEALIGFCQGIQAASPVDSYAAPEPSPEPGYTDEVVMASGSFTQGSTIELSCDGPLRAPYTCYLQGGLNFAASRAGVLLAVQKAYFKE